MPSRANLRLTDRAVKALPLPATGTKKFRDGELRGFAVQVTATGGRSWYFIYTSPLTGAERLITIATVQLAAALDAHPERTTVALIRFLLLTGCRFGEATNATWNQLDLERGTWTKPSAHTKAKRQHVVPLSALALALLAELQANAASNPLFSRHRRRDARSRGSRQAGGTLQRAADLPGVRIHDLRHSFASALAASGASLQLIGSLLGHSQIATTARYAHLADDARREAVERVGALVVGSAGQSGKVVEWRRRGA